MASVYNLSKWSGSVEEDLLDVDDEKGVKIGAAGSYMGRVTKYAPSINPASVAANETAEQDFTVAGLKAGDVVLAVNKPTVTAGLGIVNARVKADDTLSITFSNVTAGALDAAAETYEVVVATFN